MSLNTKCYSLSIILCVCLLHIPIVISAQEDGNSERIDVENPQFIDSDALGYDSEKSIANNTSDFIKNSTEISIEDSDVYIKIESIKFDKEDVESAKIKFKKPKEREVNETVDKDQKFPSGTLFIIPAKTEIVLKTFPNNNTQTLGPGSKHRATVTEKGEEHRTFWGKVKHFKNKVKSRIGSLFSYNTYGKNKRYQAAAKGTEFTVQVDSLNTSFERFSGKVEVSVRNKIELNEELGAASGEQRELFDNQTSFLSSKNGEVSFKINESNTRKLTSKKETEKFFKLQLNKQRKALFRGGPKSKKAFKFIEKGQDSLGLLKYQEAISDGEIERDDFIQAALLLSEAYFRNNKIKSIESWLEAALHFNKIEHEINQEQYDDFSTIDDKDVKEGFINSLIVSNEYYAWAYSVKLKLKSCLESVDQNPIIWRNKAKKWESVLKDL